MNRATAHTLRAQPEPMDGHDRDDPNVVALQRVKAARSVERLDRRRWAWVAAVISFVSIVAAGWWIGGRTRSPEQAAADAAPPEASWVTAPVGFRVLSRTVITRGDVRPEVAIAARIPVSVEGNPVVTQLVVGVGDEVAEGSRLIEVSGRPVFVFAGDVPVYRTLRPGMSGADVAGLQAALTRLGFAPDSDGVYGPATKAAVTAFYERAGYEPIASSATEAADIAAAEQAVIEAEAGVAAAQRALDEAAAGATGAAVAQADAAVAQAERALEQAEAAQVTQTALTQQALGLAAAEHDRIAADPEAAPGALDQAQLAVNQAQAQLDETRRSTRDAVESAREALWIAALARNEATSGRGLAAAEAAFESATVTLDRALAAREHLVSTSGPTVPQGEILFVPALPARVQQSATIVGDARPGPEGEAASTDSIVELAAGRLVVDVAFRPSEQGLVRAGTAVELLDEQTDTSYRATIASVAADPVTRTDGQVGYPAVVIAESELPSALAGANLRVTITAATTDEPALVVPLAAITSAADGSTSVRVLGADAEPVTVPVEAGLSADGWVAVKPTVAEALAEGDQVIVGR